MDGRTAVTETVVALFDLVDAKHWNEVRTLVADEIDVDFTSLAGGEPARITGDQLVDGWRVGLHARKSSWHLAGHPRVDVTDHAAAVSLKGYAWNRLDESLGGGMWEVWGTYDMALRRTEKGWVVHRFVFNAVTTRGDDTVRTHVL